MQTVAKQMLHSKITNFLPLGVKASQEEEVLHVKFKGVTILGFLIVYNSNK